jgi:hypothetical protein
MGSDIEEVEAGVLPESAYQECASFRGLTRGRIATRGYADLPKIGAAPTGRHGAGFPEEVEAVGPGETHWDPDVERLRATLRQLAGAGS